jgi:uncharacterized Zn finger protein
MSWYFYDDGRDQKEALRRKLESRRKRGEKFEPLIVPQGGRKLAHTFWGKAWCGHLESHKDYEYRLPRGRSYLRQGNVYNLSIEPGAVSASVAGSSLYEVTVTIQPLAEAAWKCIKDDCAGQVASLLDLLAGKLGDGVLRAVTDAERGLFPKPKEIRLSCTCPDHADMCKHVAAVLYGVGVKLDADPNLFFVLRSVDPSELLSTAAQETLDQAHGTDAGLSGEDLGALFGIELDSSSPAPPKKSTRKPAKASPNKKSKTKRSSSAKIAKVKPSKPKAKREKPRRKKPPIKK